jgi:hypothetical protein
MSTLSLLFRDLDKAVSFRRPPVGAPIHCFLGTSTFNSLDSELCLRKTSSKASVMKYLLQHNLVACLLGFILDTEL